MKMPFGLPTSPESKAKFYVCAAITLFGLIVFVSQLWRIHQMWTPVGFVDTWPLYDRLMKWHQGKLSLDHYLFDPHGLHLHFIIYLLYLIDVTCGSGRQLVPHFATLISIFGVIATVLFLILRLSTAKIPLTLRLCVLVVGTIVLLSGVSEATLIPFQAVVVVTRFVHFLLLAILVWCQFYPNKWLHGLALAASCVGAAFYAAGGIFAFEILLLHAIFFRRWRPLLFSWLPLASYLWFIGHYVKATAETNVLTSLLRGINPAIIAEVVKGTVCYYASALTLGWPDSVRTTFGTSEILLLSIAFVICAVTVSWALFVLISTFLKANWGTRFDVHTCISCIMALLSLFVFASAVSAALLWVARAQIFGAALGMPAHFAVLTSNRYAAFASVAFVVFLYILNCTKNRRLGTVVSLSTFTIVVGCGFNAVVRPERYVSQNRLEVAATALMMGMSPADDEASAVWPGVGADWFWPTELPKTVAYLQAGRYSYAYRMPALGQFGGSPSVMLYQYITEPVIQPSKARRQLPGGTLQERTKDMETTAFHLTDRNWRNGIWIASKAGMFFVADTDEVGKRIAPGDKISFAKSGTRNVVRVGKGTGSIISIEVEGSLDPDGDGYPNPITYQVWRDLTGNSERQGDGDVCRLTGSMASFEATNVIAPQRFFPLTTAPGEVVGYAVRNGSAVSGHLRCKDATNHPPLFLSQGN